MYISEIGLCGGHSASGVWVDEHARTTVPGLYAAGDLCNVAHNYMLGAMVFGQIAGEDAVDYLEGLSLPDHDAEQVERERVRILAPLQRQNGLQASKIEYKLRRLVNDYLQPPKVTRKMEIGLQRFAEIREDLQHVKAGNPHELMRAMEVFAILDCAELAALASLYRTESRWGLYHYRTDFPERDDARWNCFVEARKTSEGKPAFFTRPVPDYIVSIGDAEMNAYHELRCGAART